MVEENWREFHEALDSMNTAIEAYRDLEQLSRKGGRVENRLLYRKAAALLNGRPECEICLSLSFGYSYAEEDLKSLRMAFENIFNQSSEVADSFIPEYAAKTHSR